MTIEHEQNEPVGETGVLCQPVRHSLAPLLAEAKRMVLGYQSPCHPPAGWEP